MKKLLFILLLVPSLLFATVDVKSFGAKGDGIQDDAPFINKAIASALLTGDDVFISEGTYLCNLIAASSKGSLVINQYGVKNIKIYGESGTIITTSLASGCILQVYNKAKDISIEGIFFQSTHAITQNQTNAIYLQGLSSNGIENFRVKNCRFEGFSTAISLSGVRGTLIESSVFESPLGHDNAQDNTAPAVFIWMADNANGQCYDVRIINNTANGFTGTDITSTTTKRPMDGFVYGSGYGILISGNITRNFCEEHIAISPSVTFPTLNYPVLITGNLFYQSLPIGCMRSVGVPIQSNYGIRTDISNVVINNNTFFDYTTGILILQSQYPTAKQFGYTIQNNTLISPKGTNYNMTYAILIRGTVGNPVTNTVITGNQITIEEIQLKRSVQAISLNDINKLVFTNNTIFTNNIDLNGFTIIPISVSRCTNNSILGNNVY